MSDDETELNTRGLVAIMKALRAENMPTIKIGILGLGRPRSDVKGTATNALIGAAHEFGTSKLPQRSFLRMPLVEKLDAFLQKNKLLQKNTIEQVVKTKSMRGLAEKIAVTAHQVILEAFATGGFGKWVRSNMERKKVQLTLTETGQLRDSISYEIKG